MIRKSCLLLLGALAVPSSAAAQVSYATAPAPEAYAEVIAESRALLDSVMRVSGIPGLSVGVAVDGQIVWLEGLGFADVEQRTPVTPLSKFRVGSIAKSLTAAALGQLYEQGRLDLDVAVQRYVPSFPEKRWPITTRLVAGHLAGIRHYRDGEFLGNEPFGDVLAGLEIFQDDTLLFEPGTRYSYSTYGWNLLSAVVEGASGQPFLQYMREHVFGPLGMRHTVADHVDSIIPWRSGFYERRDDGAVLNAPYVDNSYKWAGGGFL
ncbi:MAG: serine hydrolase domain-containing protein, partial [Gemmatimonadales bacterium]